MTGIWHFIRPNVAGSKSCVLLYDAYCCSCDLRHHLPFYNVSKTYCMRARFMFVFIEYPLYKVHLLCKSLQYKQFLLIITGFTSTNWEKHTRRIPEKSGLHSFCSYKMPWRCLIEWQFVTFNSIWVKIGSISTPTL